MSNEIRRSPRIREIVEKQIASSKQLVPIDPKDIKPNTRQAAKKPPKIPITRSNKTKQFRPKMASKKSVPQLTGSTKISGTEIVVDNNVLFEMTPHGPMDDIDAAKFPSSSKIREFLPTNEAMMGEFTEEVEGLDIGPQSEQEDEQGDIEMSETIANTQPITTIAPTRRTDSTMPISNQINYSQQTGPKYRISFNKDSPSSTLFALLQSKRESSELSIKAKMTYDDLLVPEMADAIKKLDEKQKDRVMNVYEKFPEALEYLDSQKITLHPDEFQVIFDYILSCNPFLPETCAAVIFGYRQRRSDINEDHSKIAQKLIDSFKAHNKDFKERALDLGKQVENLRTVNSLLSSALSKHSVSEKPQAGISLPVSKPGTEPMQKQISLNAGTLSIDASKSKDEESQIVKKQKTGDKIERPLASYQDPSSENIRIAMGHMLSLIPTAPELMSEYAENIVRYLGMNWNTLKDLDPNKDVLVRHIVQVSSLHVADILQPVAEGKMSIAVARRSFTKYLIAFAASLKGKGKEAM